MVEVVGVSRARTSGSIQTKEGKKRYRGKRRHWYVYFYDDDGKFRKKKISSVQVPYYGSLIRRRKSYRCDKCGTKFRAMTPVCPTCGARDSARLLGRGKQRGRPPKVDPRSLLQDVEQIEPLGLSEAAPGPRAPTI